MKLYVIRNQEGKFFRTIGYQGYGVSWDTLEKAKFYTKIGQAKARCTYFFKNYPSFGCPEILEFDLNVANATVIDMRATMEKSIKKIKANNLKRQLADKARQTRWLNQEKIRLTNALNKQSKVEVFKLKETK
jgi:hypothetical protein